MQEYNSPEEYIKDVQRYIRWSRSKVVATRELSDHINDQYDALRENGLNQKEAMRKAIEEMGDADVVGTELDIVHRPKVNWLLLLIAGVLLLSGILISAMLTSISLTVPKIIGIVLGVCVAAFLYFIDYTVLERYTDCSHWRQSSGYSMNYGTDLHRLDTVFCSTCCYAIRLFWSESCFMKRTVKARQKSYITGYMLFFR